MTSQDAQAAATRPDRQRPPRADAVRNRARVLEAARAAFAAEGVAVPLDEIARRAGVGAGTVYRHFPTKEALFEAVIADQLAALAIDAEARLARSAAAEETGGADAGGEFFAFLASLVEDARHKADLAEALASAGVGLRAETLAAGDRLTAGLAALLHRAQEAGAVRGDVDAADLHALVVGALAAERRRASDQDAAPGKLARIICDGLRPHAGAQATGGSAAAEAS